MSTTLKVNALKCQQVMISQQCFWQVKLGIIYFCLRVRLPEMILSEFMYDVSRDNWDLEDSFLRFLDCVNFELWTSGEKLPDSSGMLEIRSLCLWMTESSSTKGLIDW